MEVKTEEKRNNLSPRAQEDYNMVLDAIDGSQKAYTMLMERYRSIIYHMMLKMVNNRDDADDLTLEAFGKAFNKISSYAPRYAFRTWLFKIAINNCIDHLRKKRLHLISIDDPLTPTSDHDFSSNIRSIALDPEEQFIRTQRLSLMRNILGGLSLKYRLMIELRFFEELTYDEIAIELEIPLGTVKAQLFRAKEMVFQLLNSPSGRGHLDSMKRRSKEEKPKIGALQSA
jgi:RNA polymerase sigma factor (sigma-70 family)